MGCFPTRKEIIIESRKKFEPTPTQSKKPETVDADNSDLCNDVINNKLVSVDHIKIKNFITNVESRVEDNYQILGKLGKGSFGEVFKVLHKDTGIIRAMKLIKKECLSLPK